MLFCPLKVVDLHTQGHTDGLNRPVALSFIAEVFTPEKFCDTLDYY